MKITISFSHICFSFPVLSPKEIISHNDFYLDSLSSETYVFEDKMSKYKSV